MALTAESCVACRADSPRVSDDELRELRQQIPDWEVKVRDGVPQLEHTYSFPDFAGALTFTQKVGELAEREQHHPTLVTEWGKVTVTWWTHKIHGLHRNDFIMAAKSDEIYRRTH